MSIGPDDFGIEFYREHVFESIGTPDPERLYHSPIMDSSNIGGTFYVNAPLPESSINSKVVHIPRTPKLSQTRSLRYYLSFHRKEVTYAHYFLFYDYQDALYSLSELFEPLRYCVVAFAALVYSVKVDISAREDAFGYYAMALRELRLLLERSPRDIEEYYAIVAAVLQLSSFDVTSFLFFVNFSASLVTIQSAFDM
jgi:hypothetical protein